MFQKEIRKTTKKSSNLCAIVWLSSFEKITFYIAEQIHNNILEHDDTNFYIQTSRMIRCSVVDLVDGYVEYDKKRVRIEFELNSNIHTNSFRCGYKAV